MNDAIHPAPTEFSADQLAADPILRYFYYSHLPPVLQQVSAPFCGLAGFAVMNLPRNAERSVALRKLLEAKDAAVRANVSGVPVPRPATFYDRLLGESHELEARLDKLDTFVGSFAFAGLDQEQQTLLKQQRDAMCAYANILGQRIAGMRPPVPASPAETVDAGDRDEIIESRVTGGGSVETPIPFG